MYNSIICTYELLIHSHLQISDYRDRYIRIFSNLANKCIRSYMTSQDKGGKKINIVCSLACSSFWSSFFFFLFFPLLTVMRSGHYFPLLSECILLLSSVKIVAHTVYICCWSFFIQIFNAL